MRHEKLALVTGSGGLIGSECARVFANRDGVWLESTTICGVGSLARLAAPRCDGTAALRRGSFTSLSYIVMCAVTGREYTIYGYKGKRAALCGAREHRRQAGHLIEFVRTEHQSTPSELRRFWGYFLVLFS
jgi:hypothetical protein